MNNMLSLIISTSLISHQRYKYKTEETPRKKGGFFHKKKGKIVIPPRKKRMDKLKLQIIYITGLVALFVYSTLDYILAFFLIVKIIYSIWNFDEIERIGVGAVIGGFAGGFASTFLGWLQKMTISIPFDLKTISEKHLKSILPLLFLTWLIYCLLGIIFIMVC